MNQENETAYSFAPYPNICFT